MDRPHRQDNRLLSPLGLSTNPVFRTCVFAATLEVTPWAHSGVRTPPRPYLHHCLLCHSFICFLCSSFHYVSPFYLLLVSDRITCPFSISPPSYVTRLFLLHVIHISIFYVCHSVARPCLSPTCKSLYCVPFIYSPASGITRIVCLTYRSSICFLYLPSCWLHLYVLCLFALCTFLTCG
jgi:hypothetical protein